LEKTEERDLIYKKIKSTCSLCERKIPSGEYYSKSIITGKISCSNCDKGILIKGDLLFFLNE
jgi:DNA-directed RNA polymerase subunit RPC12/RpoP